VEKKFGKQIARVAQAACSQVETANPRFSSLQMAERSANAVCQLDIPRISSEISDPALNGDERHVGMNGHQYRHTNGGASHDRLVEQHLAVLAEGTFNFLSQNQNPDDTNSWYIDGSKLNKFLWDKETHRLIGEIVADPALRIARMLADKGKLDERSMLDLGLLNSKELRKCLALLQTMGFIELQEVPKDPQRQPKNTFFLYFYDSERIRRVLLGKLYKTMSRMYQRLQIERTTIAPTLSKLSQFDGESEAEVLSAAELVVFYVWQQKESWFTSEIHRIDDSICILRDI
jgi:DNA-directed RNA polymerase III subunit RPC3